MRATREVVRRKVRQHWPDRVDHVMTMLESCVDLIDESERWEELRARVQLAVIKLSEGSIKELEVCIDKARWDYRDVLAHAECPEEMKSGSAAGKDLSSDERNELRSMRALDRRQYEDWLTHDPQE